MWEKRPFGQLAKCTEAQALRKAFPEAVGSQPTAEEMEGKVIEGELANTPPPVRMPEEKKTAADKPKSAPDPEGESETSAAAAEPAEEKEQGIFLADNPKNMLLKKGAACNLGEAALIKKYGRIDNSNINHVLSELRFLAENNED